MCSQNQMLNIEMGWGGEASSFKNQNCPFSLLLLILSDMRLCKHTKIWNENLQPKCQKPNCLPVDVGESGCWTLGGTPGAVWLGSTAQNGKGEVSFLLKEIAISKIIRFQRH